MERDILAEKINKITFIPIKHFSPTSARQVENKLNSCDYDILCVEMPSNAQKIVDQIASDDIVFPCSVLLINEKFTYLPLFKFSPEVVAIKHAALHGKKIVCIDTPFNDADIIEETEKLPFYHDNYNFMTYSEMNLNKDFNVYEEDILKLAEVFCHETNTREMYMAQKIAENDNKKVMVVLGANHVKNVKQSLNDFIPMNLTEMGEVHLVPYVPPEFKIQYGYFERLFLACGKSNPFEEVAVDILLQAVKVTISEYKLHISITDIINTITHAKLLAEFRGLPHLGLNELMESSKTCIEKNGNGEFERVFNDIVNKIPLGYIKIVSTPLLKDFEQKLKEFRLYNLEEGKRVILKTVDNPGHREKSKFLHSLEYLEVPFANKISGADYLTGEKRNLSREIWEIQNYKKSYECVIQLSHIGKSIYEVVETNLKKEAEELASFSLKDMVNLYLKSYLMGVDGEFLLSKIDNSISNMTSFSDSVYSLAGLNYLLNIKEIFSGGKSISDYRVASSLFLKSVNLLNYAGKIEERAEDDAYAFSALTGLILKFDNSLFFETINEMKYNIALSPIFFGSILSFLSKNDDSVLSLVKNYLTTVTPFDSGKFISGLIIGHRGMFLKEGGILDIVIDFVESLPNVAFLECLPFLRYAFTLLSPEQVERTTKYIMKYYNITENDFGNSTMFDIALQVRDKEVELQLKNIGFIKG